MGKILRKGIRVKYMCVKLEEFRMYKEKAFKVGDVFTTENLSRNPVAKLVITKVDSHTQLIHVLPTKEWQINWEEAKRKGEGKGVYPIKATELRWDISFLFGKIFNESVRFVTDTAEDRAMNIYNEVTRKLTLIMLSKPKIELECQKGLYSIRLKNKVKKAEMKDPTMTAYFKETIRRDIEQNTESIAVYCKHLKKTILGDIITKAELIDSKYKDKNLTCTKSVILATIGYKISTKSELNIIDFKIINNKKDAIGVYKNGVAVIVYYNEKEGNILIRCDPENDFSVSHTLSNEGIIFSGPIIRKNRYDKNLESEKGKKYTLKDAIMVVEKIKQHLIIFGT